MLQPTGKILLYCGLGLVATGLVLSAPAAVLAGVILVALLHFEVQRLRRNLAPMAAPLGVRTELEVLARARTVQQGRSHRVGQEISLVLRARTPEAFLGARLDIDSWWLSPGLTLAGGGVVTLILRQAEGTTVLRATPQTAAVHRVLGFRGRLTDAAGLVQAEVFVPATLELAALPRSLPMDLKSVAETRRMSPRSGMGQRPDKVPGSGDDLRELREHMPGDPFKHIAWKASAARGRLMARTFEREQTRAMFLVLETGATMRDGVPGRGALDQAMALAHSLAEACAKTHDPFGLALVDGRLVESRPVLEGMAALESTDRALLDIRRAVAEDLAPMAETQLISTVVRYLRAVARVPLPDLGDGIGRSEALDRVRQAAVMAALARLPERERVPLLRGPEPSQRADLSILRRFCRAMDLALPYRGALPPQQRVDGLCAGVRSAIAARKGPFAIVVVSDFRGLSGQLQPLLQVFAAARQAGHRVMVVAVRELEGTDVEELIAEADDGEAARGLLRADQAARQALLFELEDACRRIGAGFVGDANPREILSLWRYG